MTTADVTRPAPQRRGGEKRTTDRPVPPCPNIARTAASWPTHRGKARSKRRRHLANTTE